MGHRFWVPLQWKLSMILSRCWITKMISGLSAPDPSSFKRQLTLTFFETSVRRVFLLRQKGSPEVFRQKFLAIGSTLSCVPRKDKTFSSTEEQDPFRQVSQKPPCPWTVQ